MNQNKPLQPLCCEFCLAWLIKPHIKCQQLKMSERHDELRLKGKSLNQFSSQLVYKAPINNRGSFIALHKEFIKNVNQAKIILFAVGLIHLKSSKRFII